jgi:hypothetical protein
MFGPAPTAHGTPVVDCYPRVADNHGQGVTNVVRVGVVSIDCDQGIDVNAHGQRATAAPYDQIMAAPFEDVARATATAERNPRPEASGDEQHKVLPCGRPAVVGKPMVPYLSTVEQMEGGVRDALVLRSSGVTEVAFTAVDLLQQVAVAVKPQEFEP